ncbi:hypothetical protein KY284_020105 [Solanum tuberosum]|nr:hypothetical protein KY284_020105 [Solanum tuberosum]
MPQRKKNASPQSAPTASQSEGHDDSESSSSEVQINVTPDDQSPRATRSRAARAILQGTSPQSEEGGSHSGNGEESGSKSDAASGSQSDDGSEGSVESESGSQEDATTSPPANIEWPGIRCTSFSWSFEGKHHEITSDTMMEDQNSLERVLRWIAKQIAIDGENAVWVTTTPTLITKASLSFPDKDWWAIVRAQLRPTANDNTLSPSLASLVACLMVGYPINAGRIISTEMRDSALNERVGLPFPFMIGKLCRQVSIPPNSLIDRWGEAFRLIEVSKIKDFANYLFGVKSVAAAPPLASASQVSGTLVTIPMLFHEKLVADQRQTRTLVDQIVNMMPKLIQREVLAAKKELKDEMRKELAVLNDMMDGLENLV